MWWLRTWKQRTRTGRTAGCGHRERTNERTSDWEHVVTLIDGNVGGSETDTIDGSANGAERESEQRAAPVAPTLTDTSKTRPAGGTAPVSGGMRVRKRSGSLEPVDVNKIVNAIARASE